MKKLTYLTFFIFSICLTSKAQFKHSQVTNFSVKEYNAGHQNWCVDTVNDYIFVANNLGLLEFSGFNWHLYRLPNKTIIRSVKVIGERVYTGSYEEFGYWTRQNNGLLNYTSLRELVPSEHLKSESIWEIHEFQDKVVFKSFSAIYIYYNNSIKTIRPDKLLMSAVVAGDQFILQGLEKGLLTLKGDSLIVLESTKRLANYEVKSMVKLSDEKLLIGTSLNGCFEYSITQKSLTKWDSDFNNLLKKHQLTKMFFHKKHIYIGTVKNGVYEYNYETGEFSVLNNKYGLQNNTVLDVKVDHLDNLWIVLDNGIATVQLDAHAYYLNWTRANIGAVNDIIIQDNKTYLATNTGIFKVVEKGISFLKDSDGHAWSFLPFNDAVICQHISKLLEIKNDRLKIISNVAGGYIIKPIPNAKSKLIQGNYVGLSLLTVNEDEWTISNIDGVNFPVKNIVFEDDHTAWVTQPYKGIYRITFSNDYAKALKVENKYNYSFTSTYNIRLFNLDGKVVMNNEKQWYYYDAILDKINVFTSLNTVLGEDQDAVILNNFEKGSIVFKKPNGNVFIRTVLLDEDSQINIPKTYYDYRLVSGEGYQKAEAVNDSLIYLALYNDVLAVNTNKFRRKVNVASPKISRIFKNNKAQELASEIDLKKSDTLLVELKTPYPPNTEIEYSVEKDHWQKTHGNILINDLPYSTTTLSIRSLHNENNHSDSANVKIHVIIPWYRGKTATFLVVTLLVVIVLLVRMVNSYKLIKYKKYIAEQMNHEQEVFMKEEAIKNEVRLNELSKRQHEIELSSKAKEIANTAMEIAKKDELLEELKVDLQFFSKEVISKVRFERLLNRVVSQINTKKDWEVFETTFNSIHESFFKNLISEHPDLTPKDLKLCAYLKMNLSTKEIAPLKGISIRGVEIHRYRLRRKLKLSNNENLIEYLMSR